MNHGKNMEKNKTLFLTAFSMIFIAAFSRLIPHAPNFTAVMAMALFAGGTLPNRWLAVFVPITALFISDLLLGLHKEMFFIYIPVALIALASSFSVLSRDFSQEKPAHSSWTHLGFSSLAASLFFFAVSNFGVWLISGMYARTAQGLVTCYLMAIPFLGNQIIGDMFFSALLFGVWSFARVFVKSSSADSSRAL